MKSYSILGIAAVSIFSLSAVAATAPTPVVYESARELFGNGDFDGDGRQDVVIVDKETGKFRLGYQQENGSITWVDNRPSGIKGVTGISIGKLVGKTDAIVFTSADANQLSIADASDPKTPARPLPVPFNDALGPNTVVAVDIGGDGNTPEMDLYVTSIYNSPDPSQATLLRNDHKEYPNIADEPLPGPAAHANRLPLKGGQLNAVCFLVTQESGDTLRIENVSAGKTAMVASVGGLPTGSDFTFGYFRGAAQPEILTYKPGANGLTVNAVDAAGDGYQVTKGKTFDLGQPIRRVVTLNATSGQQLFVIFGEGQKAGVYSFDGAQAPKEVTTLTTTNEYTGAIATKSGMVAFSQSLGAKFSSRYETYTGDSLVAGPYGSLPSLADNDNVTIPEIHRRIVSNTKETEESAMTGYTNTIPGTRAVYSMVPIKGGEFTMGSPETEKDRKPDEGPQIKVKISPFWMGQFEITWNEYELFMYPDEEKRTRATLKSDAEGDKLADAVSHPSKPYVEMSFGMGKDGFPAISMTQHAANKYCQWLSAKTGHFYRLPTEAEWEYACRAGTTGKHFFGDDDSKIGDYGWYEQNSDFKYQKVGKKKPNPWGLYDIYGNVVEWVLDQYDADWYKKNAGKGVLVDPWNKATKPYPHAVRGGSWDDQAVMLRSAARRGSDRSWKMQDPQLPKSVWFFSDAQFVGFRVVRPLKVPTAEEMQKYWTSGVERD
jgi:formylglycine-generating enzyme required for sulfatase activity